MFYIFTLESTLGRKCDILATIEVVPSVEYVVCLRVKFPGNLAISKVSMAFTLTALKVKVVPCITIVRIN